MYEWKWQIFHLAQDMFFMFLSENMEHLNHMSKQQTTSESLSNLG